MIQKIKETIVTFLKSPIFYVLILGIFLRVSHPLELFLYSHDQDLLSWFVKDIVVNHNLRLIGQETSVHGVFIGPLFYYLAVPFYLLWGMSPLGGIAMVTIIGIFTIWSVSYVLSNIWGRRVGFLGSFFYAVSFYTVMTDREVVPTTPVILWSVWFLYALFQIMSGKQKRGYIVSGVLIGLVWHLNVALVLLLPLLFVAQILSKKTIQIKSLIVPSIITIFLLSPFILFEVRHNFSQIQSVITQFHTPSAFPQTKAEKFDRVIQLFEKNLGSVWGTSLLDIPRRPVLYLFPLITFVLILVGRLSKKLAIMLFLWTTLFLVFFTVNSLNLSEYYLNGAVIVFILIGALFIDYLLSRFSFYFLGIAIFILYAIINIQSFLKIPVNQSGYIQRSQIIEEIKQDAGNHGYPCVSISYITSPGANLGYRYLIYEAKLKTAPVASLAPVYTIVFPHSLVNRIDKSFGALGLIYPAYDEYNSKGVEKSCGAQDFTISEPLFGYVQ